MKVINVILYVINVFIKYAWVKHLKDMKAKADLHVFIGLVNESKHTPNKLWIDQEKKIYNKLL